MRDTSLIISTNNKISCDTLSRSNTSTIKNAPSERDWNIEVDPLSSLIIAVLFIAERFISYISKKKINKDAWYIEMLLKPNQHKIEDYFDAIQNQFESSIATLTSSGSKTKTNYDKIVIVETHKFSKINKDFDYSFIELIGTQKRKIKINRDLRFRIKILEYVGLYKYYLHLQLKITIQNIYDLCTLQINNYNPKGDPEKAINDFRIEIKKHKDTFYFLLYLPIN